jgi:hypothetical protein
LLTLAAASVILAAVGFVVFRRAQNGVPDEI